jgi:pyruvate dehydrogenase E2 component (dihydrolipoamide acetyltransferase)
MLIDIIIPRLGWSMEEATFVGWLKTDGQPVRPGEPLFTLESEKASQDIEAADGGILRIPADGPSAGTLVKVGQVIGQFLTDREIRTADAAPHKMAPGLKPEQSEDGHKATPIAAPSNARLQRDVQTGALEKAVSPRARRRAAALGVDTSQLEGSGCTGRIVEADVLKAIKSETAAPKASLSTMRRAIAKRTAESFATVPHFYLHSEVDATALLELRKQLLPEIETKLGVRLTLSDLLLRAQALALRDIPSANVIWREDGVVTFTSCDVGLVVALSDGLIIPILRSIDTVSLAALARQRASLVEAAKAGKLAAEALEGGATSLSNLGNSRVDEFTAVLPMPHSSILAVGRAVPRALPVDGSVRVRTTLKLCLSVDHRVLDGGPAGEYLGRIVDLLEHPQQLAEGKRCA